MTCSMGVIPVYKMNYPPVRNYKQGTATIAFTLLASVDDTSNVFCFKTNILLQCRATVRPKERCSGLSCVHWCRWVAICFDNTYRLLIYCRESASSYSRERRRTTPRPKSMILLNRVSGLYEHKYYQQSPTCINKNAASARDNLTNGN